MKIEIQRNNEQVALIELESFGPTKYEIAWLFVDARYRGRKLAAKLLAKAKNHAGMLVAILAPADGLNSDQMKAWLIREGFKHGWHRGKRALWWPE